ncbi:MAG: hypothetical protein IMZ72_12725 [Cutibacterium acnes]|jgi:hypothetical protein|nr:hypothetical protein [Cutibacterium acnes]
MTFTAYSARYARELDVDQLLRLVTGAAPEAALDSTAAMSNPALQGAIADLECPSCFSKGASVVREGRNQKGKAVRQAHFRFRGADGSSNHHPLCDFFGNDAIDAPRAGAVNFADEKSAVTRAIRHLVCAGIELGMFNQAHMRELRKWHFEMRRQHRFVVTVPATAVAWCFDIVGNRTWEHEVAFSPEFGDLPDFNWRLAARGTLTARHRNIIDAFTALRGWGYVQLMQRATALMARNAGNELFDAVPLEPYYKATVTLAHFAAGNWTVLASNARTKLPLGADPKAAPLMAVCALLLWVSNWDVAAAARKLTTLILAPEANDLTLGNFIGLNPFHDFGALRIVRLVEDVTAGLESAFNYQADLAATIEALKAQHAMYRK